jgi:phosphoserine phosphatase RsbU/P
LAAPVYGAADVEARRLDAVRRYDILDTPPDGVFDRLTALAARYFKVPISVVSIVDTDRIWFKSHHGVDVYEVGRDPGLCASAILQPHPWVVENAGLDPRTLANPLVAGELGLRFYAGVPLTTSDGYNLGTFCIIDQEPRTISDDDLEVLRDLAAVVMDQLELRLEARRTVVREHQLREQAEAVLHRLQQSLLPPDLPAVPGADVAAWWEPARGGELGGDFYDLFQCGDERWSVVIGDVCGKGVDAAAVTALARYTLRAAALQTSSPCATLQLLNDALLRQRPGDERFVTAVYATAHLTEQGVRATVCSAGHVLPLLRRADGTIATLPPAGLPLGLFDDPQLTDTHVDLGSGDALVLYTDGVTEARRGNVQFGGDRLKAILAETVGATAEKTADAIRREVGRFQGGQSADDTAVPVLALPPE